MKNFIYLILLVPLLFICGNIQAEHSQLWQHQKKEKLERFEVQCNYALPIQSEIVKGFQVFETRSKDVFFDVAPAKLQPIKEKLKQHEKLFHNFQKGNNYNILGNLKNKSHIIRRI